MTRPTVNDIARAAGVSLATVDRVINARAGVRAKTIDRVNEAIDRLGYVRDLAAANLARQRNYRVAFVLPAGESEFIATIAETIGRSWPIARLDRTMIEVIRFPGEDPHALAAILGDLGAGGQVDGVALMAPETPPVRDAVRGLRAAGVAVVALVSDLPNSNPSHFVGIDNAAAGRTAAVLLGRFLGSRPGPVMVVAESMLLRESIERRLGFDAVMQARFPGREVLQTLESHGSARTLAEIVGRMVANAPDIAGVYAMGGGNRALTRTLAALDPPLRPVIIAHELTPHARAMLRDGTIDAVITQNVGHLVRSALRVLRAHADGVPIDPGQEQIRIDIVINENLPPGG
jgi:LacI family transcriptional regulator